MTGLENETNAKLTRRHEIHLCYQLANELMMSVCLTNELAS